MGELATRIYSKLILDVLEPLFASSKIGKNRKNFVSIFYDTFFVLIFLVGAVLEFEANIGFFGLNGTDKRTSTDLMKRFLEEVSSIFVFVL